MNSEALKHLGIKAQAYSQAYVRNLVAAENAVLAGQFNAAKILRAAAHSQRALAMNAARLTSRSDAIKVFEAIISEIGTGKVEKAISPVLPDSRKEIQRRLKECKVVEDRLKEILARALASLKDHSDVLESDVDQFIWGCYGCGYLIEGDLPDACPNCGALSIEFEGFGPFYSSTSEHLGQRTPQNILSILEIIPEQVEKLIVDVDENILSNKPSKEEWCVKEIVGHMIEVDGLFLKRVQTITQNQGFSELPSTAPPWKLQEGKGYEDRKVSELIGLLRQTRSTTLDFLTDLKNEDWTREGYNQGRPISLLDLGTWLTNHDIGHVAQIKRYFPTST